MMHLAMNDMRKTAQLLDEKGDTWSQSDIEPIQVSWQKWQYLSRLKKNLLGEKEY
jgi:hypothetical protein